MGALSKRLWVRASWEKIHLILTRKQELVVVGNLALWIARKKIKRESQLRIGSSKCVCTLKMFNSFLRTETLET